MRSPAQSSVIVLQVSVDNIDQDLFRTGVRGGSFQPSDDTLHAIKSKAIHLLTDAYQKDLVRLLVTLDTSISHHNNTRSAAALPL